MTSRNIACISGGVYVPSTRYRVDAVMQGLQQRGWSYRSIYGYGTLDRRLTQPAVRKAYRLACRARRAAVTSTLRADGPVVVQRLAIPTWGQPEVTLARRNDKVVFDFDDAVFLDPQLRECKHRRRALDRVFHAVRHVVAGNEWLASNVPSVCDVSVIPTCLDTKVYRPASDSSLRSDGVRIGWIGTSTNFRHLEQLVEPLRVLRSRFDGVSFHLCSDVKDESLLRRLGAKFVPWSADTEVQTLQSFDIGVMPLAMNDWCRGKCAFKLIQYLAVGISSVSSPVGMNKEVVREGVDGLFAHDGEWLEPLSQLVSDHEYRKSVGEQARITAEKHFSLDVAVESYDRILSGLL